MKSTFLPFLLLFVICVSCQNAKKDAAAAATPPVASTMPQKLSEKGGDDTNYMLEKYSTGSLMKQQENGEMTIKANKRSAFESIHKSQFDKKSLNKKQYKVGDYKTSDWLGTKKFASKAYKTERAMNSMTKSFRDSEKSATELSKKSDADGKIYTTDRYKTDAAREANRSALSQQQRNANEAQKSYQQDLLIQDFKSQRTMNINDSRKILGR